MFISSREDSESEVSLSSVSISSSISLVLPGGSIGSSSSYSFLSSTDFRSLMAFKKSKEAFSNALWLSILEIRLFLIASRCMSSYFLLNSFTSSLDIFFNLNPAISLSHRLVHKAKKLGDFLSSIPRLFSSR